MKRLLKGALAVFVLGFGLGSIQNNALAVTKGQDKLLAKRAAQVDAYRKLTEILMGVNIDSQTTVRDFVAESDDIRAGFDHFVKGLKVVGQPRYFDDGTCEVDVQATIEQVMLALETIVKTDPFGNRTVFRDMVNYNRKKVFVATGVGVPPSQAEPEAPAFEETSRRGLTDGIPGWENVSARGRLMAERAAKVDAYRNLAETVNGFRISANTYVRDFVAESDEIRTSLDSFLKGAKQVGPARYLPDGIVEVEVQITLQEVIKHLQTLQERWVTQGRNFRVTEFRNTRFETIVGYYPKKIITAVGNGTVPGKYMGQTSAQPQRIVSETMPQWAMDTIQATGFGVPAQGQTGTEARLMAERAAKLDAMRNLTEKVYGVYIDSQTTVRDFVTENDTIQARVKQYLAGAEQVGEARYLPDGSVEVTVQIPLREIYVVYKETQNL